MDRSRRNILIGAGSLGALGAAGLSVRSCAKSAPPPPKSTRPQRPPGQPKAMVEEDIAPTLARLDRWYAAHLRPDRYALNPPASEAELDSFERLVGIKLPSSYRQLYRWHDGENDDRWGHIYGLPLLPLKDAGFQWRMWNRVLADFKGDRYAIPGGAWPAGAVDPAYINPRWIPLTHDGSGNHIGLDFDPWPAGRVGQIILFGRDEDVKAVLAPSLGAFLSWIADLLESGNFRSSAAPGEMILREFRLKTPPEDSFMDGARKLARARRSF